MFCIKCGKQLDEGTKFCLYCGAIQEEEIESTVIPEETDLSGELDIGDGVASDFGEVRESEDAAYKELLNTGSVQTAQAVPIIEPTVVKPEKRRRKPMRAVPTVFICVLFSILTFAFAVGSTALWEVRSSFKNGAVSEAVTHLSLLDLDAKDVITDTEKLEEAIAEIGIENVEIVEVDEDETLGEWIERTLDNFGTTEDDAKQFLEESELMPYITEVVSGYEKYLLTGEDDKAVSDKKLREMLVECMNYISDEFGYRLSSDYEERLDKFFSKNKSAIRAANPSKAFGENGKYIKYCLSLPVIITVAVLALLFAALAGVITRRPDAAFITFGVPVTLSGILFACVGLFPELVLDRVDIPNNVIGDSVEILVANFAKLGGIEAAAGVLFIIAFIVYRVVATKLAKKKALRNA